MQQTSCGRSHMKQKRKPSTSPLSSSTPKATQPTIIIPHRYTPRRYQVPFWQKMQSGTKRAVLVWHRRAGKDKTALNYTISQMFPENGGRIGTYYHFLPTYNQGKKIIWDGINFDGMKFMDHFPPELVASKNETEMQVTLTNGSIYQVIGTDKMDNIVGTNPVGCVFSEYSLQNPKAWDLFRPILRENKGWALFIYTPRGRNHGKQLYEMAKNNPEWFCELRTVLDTEREDGSPIITAADIENDRKEGMDEQLIQRVLLLIRRLSAGFLLLQAVERGSGGKSHRQCAMGFPSTGAHLLGPRHRRCHGDLVHAASRQGVSVY